MHALFRCDALANIGIGHVMRCIAFADTLRWAGWSCMFAIKREGLDMVPVLATSGFEVRAVDGNSWVGAAGAALTIIDHYGLDAKFERDARAQGATVIVFDDLADRPHDCSILVDPTPQRRVSDYQPLVPEGCRLMLGPKHAIVHARWFSHRAAARSRLAMGRPVKRVVVSMGGTDPHDATSRVLDALAAARLDAHVDVVLGAGAPHRMKIASSVGPSLTLHVDPPDLVALVASADLAIGAPGASSFERAMLGVPAILIQLADNQRLVGAGLAAAEAADVVPAALLDDPAALGACIAALAADSNRRAAMSRNAAALTDGRGRLRLLAAIAGRAMSQSGRSVCLRLAEVGDEARLLDLQRQESTRRFARNPAIPSAEEHAVWFSRALDDPKRLLTIIEVDGVPSGMVRLDRSPDEALSFEISIAVDGRRHGEGIGRAALELVRQLAPGADLIATVMPENRSSLALFAAAGFRPEGNDRYRCRAA
jgi:UDP-2,4-diacetamido-2,4,6-trideoxy-beta-L-altropyranose hydrolase